MASSDKSPAAAAGMYNYSTVESQMRYLSDMAFMMHDFTLAASTLRLLQGDYKADKAMRHYAAAQVRALGAGGLSQSHCPPELLPLPLHP